MTDIYFAKLREDARYPSEKRDEDAGYDIYACFDEDMMVIPPHTTKMIPTGIASACSDDYCFILKERGSTGSKGIAQRCGVIDSGYRGEWFVPLTNTTDYTMAITKNKESKISEYVIQYPYDKAIAQALLIPVPKAEVHYISHDKLDSFSSERGVGMLGSTNL